MSAVIKRQRIYRSFADGYNFYKLFGVFFICSFLGVVIEMIWCVITNRYLESRQGLIYGPFNLVYGFGGLLITIGLRWLSAKRDLWIFFGGMLIGSLFEYLCSWVQEMMFGTVSWEYSGMRFNLNGRINLLYSFFWGILALLWVKNIYPAMSNLIEKIPNKIGKPLTWILLVFMILNSLISALAVYRQTERYHNIPAENVLEEFLDNHYPDDFLKKIYPNMQYVSQKSDVGKGSP